MSVGHANGMEVVRRVNNPASYCSEVSDVDPHALADARAQDDETVG